jgi:hypothetical protein
LEKEHRNVDHPLQMIDLVCIANLGTWTFSRMAYVPPSATVHSPIATELQKRAGAAMTAVMGPDGLSMRSPIAVLIATLYERFSYGDPALAGVADGFRLTDTQGSASGLQRMWNLQDLYDDDVIRQLPVRGLSRSDVNWQTRFV